MKSVRFPRLPGRSSATRSPRTTTRAWSIRTPASRSARRPTGSWCARRAASTTTGRRTTRFAPRAGFAWQPFGGSGRLVIGGGYGWFYQAPIFSGNAGSAPLFTSPPFAQSFTNTDASNNLSDFRAALPRHHARLRAAHAYVAVVRPRRRTAVPDSAAAAVEPDHEVEADADTVARPGIRRVPRRPAALRARLEPAVAGDGGTAGELRLRRRRGQLHHDEHVEERETARARPGRDADRAS